MPSWHSGSSVDRMGFTLRSFSFLRQFFTWSFQSHVCFSMSNARPAGQRIACKPCNQTVRHIDTNHVAALKGTLTADVH